MKEGVIITKEKALTRLMKLCSEYEKCKSDVAQKMMLWEIPDDDASRIIERLELDNFINEERYALAFTKDKIRFNKWGRNKVRYQLGAKRISEVNISTALSNYDEEEYLAMVRKEIILKTRKVSANSDWERRGKVMQFSQTRGYESDIVMTILDDLL